jgi:3-methyladenine DNA glycosylase AlkD
MGKSQIFYNTKDFFVPKAFGWMMRKMAPGFGSSGKRYKNAEKSANPVFSPVFPKLENLANCIG